MFDRCMQMKALKMERANGYKSTRDCHQILLILFKYIFFFLIPYAKICNTSKIIYSNKVYNILYTKTNFYEFVIHEISTLIMFNIV